MKQLFVTFNTKIKKKEAKKDIFLCCERKEEKYEYIENSKLINLPEKLFTTTLNTVNSVASSTTNSSIDSKKLLYNVINPDQQTSISANISFNSNTISNNSNSANTNKFLGKKYKIHFNIDKNEDIKEININNFNTINNSNSQSMDGTITNKEIEKTNSMELIEEKNYTNEIINDMDAKIKKVKNKEKIKYLNTGRWSFNEHIKFIEAIVEYGKNWREVQKYVGSRSSAQARSHAQKFFLKLKTIKNQNYILSSNSKIKSLSDIIEIIKKKDEYAKEGKDFIIKTLINLSESIPGEYLDLGKNIKKKIKTNAQNKKDNDFAKEDNTLNNKELKFDIFHISNNNDNIKNEKDIKFKNLCNNNQIDKDNEKINENKNIEGKNQINEIKINKDIINNDTTVNNDMIKNKKMEDEKEDLSGDNNNKTNYFQAKEVEAIKVEKEENNNYFEENSKRQNYFIDEGVIIFFDDTQFFNLDNIGLKIKEYSYLKNLESLNLLYNKNFFS